jgi:FimV-like protein
MKRNISAVITALIGCLLLAGNAGAVGLGQLRADSAINQPLSVRIQLIDLGSTPLEEVEIAVAAGENFERLGVEFAPNFPQIDIVTGVDADGAYARLTSSSPVRAAYLEIVLDTRWPSGRVLTQHTILLDPPVFAENEQVGTSDVALNPEPAAESAGSAVTPVTVSTDRSSTLYSIAMAARPNQGITVQQTMLAIQRLNPRSFGGGNINRLYAGEILRLPTEEQTLALSAAEALEAVRRQNQEAAGNVVEETPASVNLSAEPTVPSGGQLSVVVTNTSDLERENSALDARIQELEDQLALSQEEVARAARERADFISRLEAIERQITAAQEIIRLQDEQLAQLAQSLAAAAIARDNEVAATPPIASSVRDASAFLGQPLVAAAAAGIAILLLVLFLLRRSRDNHEADGEVDVIKFDAQSTGSGDSAAPQTDTADRAGGEQMPKAEPLLGSAAEADAASTKAQDELDKELMAILAEEDSGAGIIKPQASSQPMAPAFDPEELTFRAQDEAPEAVRPVAANVIDEDEAATKLELAYAYHKMGDNAGAAEILLEVLDEGGEAHKVEAQKLLALVNALAERSREDSGF